ncbi:DUF2948 family protein [Ferrovibrio sp.]|uniref:DUF2948 family protein n=1 Tax=Ferrovibrio sp. TaxID=1917215 RepID=UPI001B409085|nr:DUF2948 family protein [Ferrovibrio sp.]MBP7063050.1 DUF2948 family protein [Ferrovibrio sp.]
MKAKLAPLRLRAEDAEDITVLSACLQDATLSLADIAWQPRQRRFTLLLRRFRWEDEAQETLRGLRKLGAKPHFRSQAGLHFDGVLRVQRLNLDQRNSAQMLELLSVLAEPAQPAAAADDPAASLTLIFAGGGAIRLDVECIAAELQDIGLPYPVRRVPKHRTDDAAES